MEYTQNYQFRKPIRGVDNADIDDLNYNWDRQDAIDNAFYRNFAQNYDSSATYNTGDVVMYEFLLYKCLEDEVTGSWDETKWERTTAGEAGGSTVEPNPTDPPTEELESLGIDGIVYEIVSSKVYGEASGDLITLTDASAAPAKELKVTLEPQQDLHGYDSPWVGGAGKNLYGEAQVNYRVNTTTGEIESATNANWISNRIEVSGNPCTITFFDKGDMTNGSINIARYKADGSFKDTVGFAYFNSTTPFTHTYTETDVYSIIMFGYQGGGATAINTAQMQVELGTTATTYKPYSNICPISGWDEVKVNVRAINLWDEEWELGGYNVTTGEKVSGTSRIRNKNMIAVIPGQTIFLKLWDTATNDIRLFYYDKNKSFITVGDWIRDGSIEVPNNCYWINFYLATSYGTTYNNDISINYPSTDTEYHAYQGQTYTIQLGSTYYGGELDVKNGVLRVNKKGVDMEDLTWTYHSASDSYTDYFDTNSMPSDSQIGNRDVVADILCEIYKPITSTNIAHTGYDNGVMALAHNTRRLVVCDQRFTSASDLQTALDGVMLVYALTTPQEIQLTPTEVTLLLGINNIGADSGDTYVKYKRDLNIFLNELERRIKALEEG